MSLMHAWHESKLDQDKELVLKPIFFQERFLCGLLVECDPVAAEDVGEEVSETLSSVVTNPQRNDNTTSDLFGRLIATLRISWLDLHRSHSKPNENILTI